MSKRDRMSGNEAVAIAMKQINPDVMGAFPITPSTEIPQYYSQYIANGEVDTEFVAVESEHSAMSVCMGAAAAGARAVTATSSAGLAYMWELLYVAASQRLPITMAVVNRALTGPININNDHSDSMGARDSGWIQIYAESNQEVYDNYIQAMPISETIRLPIMVCQDGFITSHGVSNIELMEDEEVKEFVGEYEPDNYLLKHDNPLAVGPYGISPYYMEAKRSQAQAMKDAMPVIMDVAKRFEKVTGRKYGFFEEYMIDDADVALVVIGSSAGTGKEAVDRLRAEGKRVGLIKLRVFRPFPRQQLAEAMLKVKAVAIMDKAECFSNSGGPLFSEARNSEIYVDKSELIKYTNKVLHTSQKCICVSRPRRFGKSMAANMLAAYYSRGCDSEALFDGLKIENSPDFHDYLNRYDVIALNMQEFLS